MVFKTKYSKKSNLLTVFLNYTVLNLKFSTIVIYVHTRSKNTVFNLQMSHRNDSPCYMKKTLSLWCHTFFNKTQFLKQPLIFLWCACNFPIAFMIRFLLFLLYSSGVRTFGSPIYPQLPSLQESYHVSFWNKKWRYQEWSHKKMYHETNRYIQSQYTSQFPRKIYHDSFFVHHFLFICFTYR